MSLCEPSFLLINLCFLSGKLFPWLVGSAALQHSLGIQHVGISATSSTENWRADSRTLLQGEGSGPALSGQAKKKKRPGSCLNIDAKRSTWDNWHGGKVVGQRVVWVEWWYLIVVVLIKFWEPLASLEMTKELSLVQSSFMGDYIQLYSNSWPHKPWLLTALNSKYRGCPVNVLVTAA